MGTQLGIDAYVPGDRVGRPAVWLIVLLGVTGLTCGIMLQVTPTPKDLTHISLLI